MLGLAILFGLGLWLLVAIVTMVIGATFGRRPATKLLGAFLGFMLTMGGFIVYWTVEYYQIQRTVTHLCETEGGITVYVTPEEFNEHINLNNWENLPKYSVLPKGDERNEEYILFEGKEYEGFRPNISIPKITIYNNEVDEIDLYTIYREKIYVFNQPRVVLVKYTSVHTGTGAIANTLDGLKSWINSIEDCSGYNKVLLVSEKIDLYRQEIKNEQ